MHQEFKEALNKENLKVQFFFEAII